MGYTGLTAKIPLGLGGLHVDDPQDKIPPTALILASNIALKNGLIEKEAGSKRFNQNAVPGGVKAFYDWWPDDVTQRLIVVGGDGKVYRLKNAYSLEEITAADADTPATLTPTNQTHILPCGAESAGRARKLMIFTGNDPVQVIEGDGTTRRNIENPAADWSGSNQPSFGFIHKGRVIALGNRNDPHRFYVSDDDDHETFDSGGAQYSVYPGEGERLFSAYVYKDRAFLFKYPAGVYYIDDQNPNIAEWGIGKVSSSFGAASAHPACEALDDLLIANTDGTVTSLKASAAYGDVQMGDIFTNLRLESFVREITTPSGNLDRHAIYYSEKKTAMFTYRAAGETNNTLICNVDVSFPNQPRVTWTNKDQPTVLGLRKDQYGVLRPAYGGDDGYIYLMEQADREVEGQAFKGEFQTPHLDFGWLDANLAETNKIYQFLELTFEPTGRYAVYVDTYIDGIFYETITFNPSWGQILSDFLLGTDSLTPRVPRSIRKPLHGAGRRISFHVYNEGYRENFKLIGLTVYFKPSGQQQRDGES